MREDRRAVGLEVSLADFAQTTAASERLNVLITTSYYWPEAAGSAPYLTGLAEHLSRRGHRVVVATTFAHYPEWKSSADGRLATSEIRAGVEIRRRAHYVPRRQTAGERALYEATLYVFGLTALPLRRRPDVIIGTCPSLAGGALAATASAVYGAPYALVFQDLMGLAAAQSGVRGGDRVAAVVRATELALARRANRIAVIAEGFRPYFIAAGIEPAKIDRLRNWTRRVEPAESAGVTRRRLGWRPDEFVCVHGGNMGQKQGLDHVLEAAALLQEDDVRVVFVGDGNDRVRLVERARSLGLANVDFLGMQGPGRWEELMQAADVLLVNQRESVADMSLPSKLTSYFAAGRPVVAACSAESETAREIQQAGAGYVVGSGEPAALRDMLVSLKANPSIAARLAETARRYAETTLSAETILAEYEEFVARVAESRRPGSRAAAPVSR
jgi:colanic acid biosynthesis glycosyl transferase WcaI